MKIRCVGPAFVTVQAAGVPPQVRIALKSKPVPLGLGGQQHSVSEAQNFAVLGMESCLVRAVGRWLNYTPQLIRMAGDVAGPNALPTASQIGAGARFSRGGVPLMIEGCATTTQQ